MSRPHPNAHLIGDPKARSKLATPALIVDLPVLEANIATAAELTRKAHKGLRPHFKAHKSLEIAKRQLEHGTVGLSVATVSEAEAVSVLDCEILLTSVVSTETQCRRIADLAAAGCVIIAVVDHPETARILAQQGARAGTTIDVLIDLDMGRHRSGCPTPEAARALAYVVAASSNLLLRGLQAYAGQLSHHPSFAERSSAHVAFSNALAAYKDAVADFLPANAIISGGSTGSMNLDLVGRLNELQCGTYAMMDVEYLDLDSGWARWPFEPALLVQSSVLSANWLDHVIADAGDKWFANKYGMHPRIVGGGGNGTTFETISDEHARVTASSDVRLRPGDRIECLPPHCDPTVNLFGAYHVFIGERLLNLWQISASGL